jgi:hypothetical protein
LAQFRFSSSTSEFGVMPLFFFFLQLQSEGQIVVFLLGIR